MTITPQITDYEPFFALVAARTGLVFDDLRRDDVIRQAHKVVQSNRLAGINDLIVSLQKKVTTSALWQQLIQSLTIDETYFHRNMPHLDTLRLDVLPEIIDQRRRSGHPYLRIWSAGCASGEEPYTLAMLLRDLIPDIEQWTITLLATDINTSYLERARKGIYRSRSFRNETPPEIRERWFTQEGDGYKIVPVIRNMVTFAPLNLVSDDYPSYESSTMNMDVIVCRNVTIYFDRETTRQVVGRFHQSLTGGGWLVVGHAEPQADIYSAFWGRFFDHAVFYQKAFPRPIFMPELSDVWRYVVLSPKSEPEPDVQPALAIPETKTEDAWQRAKQAADGAQWDDALKWLEKAAEANPLQSHVYHLHGVIQLQMGDIDGGRWSLRQAIYCDPDFAIAHYALGELFHREGAIKLAVRHWRQAQAIIADLDPMLPLPYGDDLTGEMLQGLLAQRLQAVTETEHVNL